jgi:hypothetical protein
LYQSFTAKRGGGALVEIAAADLDPDRVRNAEAAVPSPTT